MANHLRLAAVLGEFAHALLEPDDVAGLLERLCRRVVDVLPVAGAGVMLRAPGGGLTFATATGERLTRLGRLQGQLGEGPCTDADASGEEVLHPDLGTDGRWPRFAPVARAAGLSSVAALPLVARGEPLGVFDLYREAAGGLDPDDLAAARTLAEVASVHLAHARERARTRAAEERLRAREQYHREVLDSMPPATAVLDPGGTIVSVNAAWTRRQRVPYAVGVGAGFRTALQVDTVPSQSAAAWDGVSRVLGGQEFSFGMDLRTVPAAEPDRAPGSHADGDRWLRLEASALTADGGGAVVILTDITAAKLVQEQLFHQVTHDPLTGLANRTLFTERLTHSLAARRRSGTLAVLFIDLDQFKLVNDSYGHAVGDQLLIEVAGRIADSVRPQDTVARFAGDEFLLLCDGLDTELQAVAVAARVQRALALPIRLPAPARDVTVTASIGVAVSTPHRKVEPVDADQLLQSADAAMFDAKAAGRDRYAVFTDPLHPSARQRLELIQELRRAVTNGELLLHFQPLAHLHTGAVIGVEALTRWQPPDGPLQPAAEFIEVAEDSGLITDIDRWALVAACEQAAAWAGGGFPAGRVTVNVSASRLADPRLVPDVRTALARSPLPAGSLVLEITESAVVQRPAQAARTMGELRDLGVAIALDDFGTGQSSLAYLRQFPVDIVKLDRSFLSPSTGGRDSRLIAGLLHLVRALELTVIAEGIETLEQLAVLQELGRVTGTEALYGQGYLLAPPAAPERRPPPRVPLPVG